MESITISKNEFIQFVTNGYPIDLDETEEAELYSTLTAYVNSADNSFTADMSFDSVYINAGMKTEICQVKYSEGKILILTQFGEDSEDFSTEYTDEECKVILAQACHGIVTFIKTYAVVTGKIKQDVDLSIEKLVGDNTKISPWIMK